MAARRRDGARRLELEAVEAARKAEQDRAAADLDRKAADRAHHEHTTARADLQHLSDLAESVTGENDDVEVHDCPQNPSFNFNTKTQRHEGTKKK